MSDREHVWWGGHSSRRLMPAGLLVLSLSAAWAQEAAKPADEPAKPVTPAADKPHEEPAAPIKLYLGEARDLLPPEQWETLVATQPSDSDDSDLPSIGPEDDVRVKGDRPAPKVPSGIAGLFWALRHPTQAWRALTPAPASE